MAVVVVVVVVVLLLLFVLFLLLLLLLAMNVAVMVDVVVYGHDFEIRSLRIGFLKIRNLKITAMI